MAELQAAERFSLVLGGPLYQVLLRLRLVEPPIRHVERRIVATLAITWLPVVVFALAAGTTLGGAVPFLYDVDAQVRLLIALPLLVMAEPLVHDQLSRQVRHFLERGLIAGRDQARFGAAVDDIMKVRNSMVIELVLLVCALGIGYWAWRQEFASRIGTWAIALDPSGSDRLSAAGAWYAFVSLGLFRFILFRWYFRLALWYLFLWRVSRLPLRLNALHPDRAGGIGFLAGSLIALAPILVAQSATIAGAIAGWMAYEGSQLDNFRLEIGGAVAVLVALGVLPLLFFAGPLLRAGLEGKREYGLLAMRYADEFRDKRLRAAPGTGEPLVGSGDIQSLADLGGSYDRVQQMRMLPVDLKAIVRFALLIAMPFAPLLLFVIPLNELLSRVVKQLL